MLARDPGGNSAQPPPCPATLCAARFLLQPSVCLSCYFLSCTCIRASRSGLDLLHPHHANPPLIAPSQHGIHHRPYCCCLLAHPGASRSPTLRPPPAFTLAVNATMPVPRIPLSSRLPVVCLILSFALLANCASSGLTQALCSSQNTGADHGLGMCLCLHSYKLVERTFRMPLGQIFRVKLSQSFQWPDCTEQTPQSPAIRTI